jgi:hypothetical protein
MNLSDTRERYENVKKLIKNQRLAMRKPISKITTETLRRLNEDPYSNIQSDF